MAHFYGTVRGARSEATRTGTRETGITATAATRQWRVETYLRHDADGTDRYLVVLRDLLTLREQVLAEGCLEPR